MPDLRSTVCRLTDWSTGRGAHGFAREYVMLAHELSDAGFVAVAACWFSGGTGEGVRFITPIACPDAPRPGLASSPEALVPHVAAPILLLHGDQDSPDDGGSPMTNVRMARAFEGALRSAGRDVEAFYYPEGTHNGLFASPKQHQDEVRRMVAFLRRTLVN